jgi:hypothetical protein
LWFYFFLFTVETARGEVYNNDMKITIRARIASLILTTLLLATCDNPFIDTLLPAIPLFKVIIEQPNNGWTIVAKPPEAKAGTLISLTVTPVTPDNSDVLKELRIDIQREGFSDYPLPKNEPYTFVMPDSDVTVKAEFEPKFKVNIDQLIGGTIVAQPPEAMAETPISLTVTPNEGYVLKEGSLHIYIQREAFNDLVLPNSEPYTFDMPDSDVTVKAEFVQKFKVNIDQLIGGTIVAQPPEAIVGTLISLTVTPNEGYVLKEGSLLIQREGFDDLVPKSEPYTFPMPDSDVTVKAEFVLKEGTDPVNEDDPADENDPADESEPANENDPA